MIRHTRDIPPTQKRSQRRRSKQDIQYKPRNNLNTSLFSFRNLVGCVIRNSAPTGSSKRNKYSFKPLIPRTIPPDPNKGNHICLRTHRCHSQTNNFYQRARLSIPVVGPLYAPFLPCPCTHAWVTVTVIAHPGDKGHPKIGDSWWVNMMGTANLNA